MNASQVNDDVLVVGAGPVGLTTACQLARLGVEVRVVERGVALTALTQDADGVDVTLRTRDGDRLALICPDGYLGLLADSADAAVLRRYLDDVLPVNRLTSV